MCAFFTRLSFLLVAVSPAGLSPHVLPVGAAADQLECAPFPQPASNLLSSKNIPPCFLAKGGTQPRLPRCYSQASSAENIFLAASLSSRRATCIVVSLQFDARFVCSLWAAPRPDCRRLMHRSSLQRPPFPAFPELPPSAVPARRLCV